ncbi:MAG: M23 family metallopeptidase [Bellilinea sp.]|jgi:murein DD-endopeptidase MepM/ murein hydrolase activator NlpD
MSLGYPGDGLSITNRYGGPCTTRGCPEGSVHAAVDFSGSFGNKTPIKAAYDGYVKGVWVNEAADLGLKVVLEHEVFGYKFYSVYAHLNYIDLEHLTHGQFVTTGTFLGMMGNTPYPGGSIHLHFEIRKPANIRWSDQNQAIVTGDSKSYWALSYEDMRKKFVNLGPRFGYSPYYPISWPKP